VDLPVLHIPEQHIGPHGLRDEVGGAQQLLQGEGLFLAAVEQIVTGGKDAHDVVNVLIVYRKAGQA